MKGCIVCDALEALRKHAPAEKLADGEVAFVLGFATSLREAMSGAPGICACGPHKNQLERALKGANVFATAQPLSKGGAS